MKQIKLVRVDNRLVHAQIILIWLKHININTIIIVDNEIATNPFLIQVYKLTIPPHISLKVFTTDEMISYTQQKETYSKIKIRTMVLMKSINIAVELHKKGMDISQLQIGGISLENNQRPNQIISILSHKYENELHYLECHNVFVYLQSVPEDTKVQILYQSLL
ncbi:MAG: PTS sugar transporter subunit IIB [Longicatena sp.]